MLTPTKRVAALATALLTALALSACGDDGEGSGDGDTLTLWHYEGPDSAMGKAWDAAIKEFEDTHPGVTVDFEEKGFEQIQKTAPMVLNSNDAPDLMEYNKGNATAGLLAKQGLLTDLSAEASQRGWEDLLSPSLQTTARYDDNGIMGSGEWYGIPNYAEYVMVYYNKDLFAEHSVEVPTTYDELVAAMDAFTAAGMTPLALAGGEYPAQQMLYQLALSQADRSWVDAYQLYQGDVDFQDDAWTYGAQTFADWKDKGYVDKDATGIKAEDMGVSFISGGYPMMVSGSWWYGRLQEEITGFEWGTFLFPGSTMSLGSSGNLWVVPENSDAKDLAYDFIDITMSEEIQNILGNNGGIPVAADPEAVTDEKSRELISNFQTLSDNDGLAFYPDWAWPGGYDGWVSATQKIMSGDATPSEALAEIAAQYQDYVDTLPQ